MTNEQLLAYRDELQKAIFSGVRRVRNGEREVEFSSISEMRQALADINNALGVAPSIRTSLVSFKRG